MARFWVLCSKDHLHAGQANDQGWSYEARSDTASSGILGVRMPLGADMSSQNTQNNFGAPNSLWKPPERADTQKYSWLGLYRMSAI